MADGDVKIDLDTRKSSLQVRTEFSIARMSLATAALAYFRSLPGGYRLSESEQAAYENALKIVANA